jgi:hypothetical protein
LYHGLGHWRLRTFGNLSQTVGWRSINERQVIGAHCDEKLGKCVQAIVAAAYDLYGVST